jgi:hypothetical protein
VPKTNLLLVLIVTEAALRSTLVARLALSGATVWTARSFDEKRPASVRAPALLVTDEESIARHPAGVVALSQEAQWRKVVVLVRGAAPVSEDGRLLYLARSDAVPVLARLLDDWRRGA